MAEPDGVGALLHRYKQVDEERHQVLSSALDLLTSSERQLKETREELEDKRNYVQKLELKVQLLNYSDGSDHMQRLEALDSLVHLEMSKRLAGLRLEEEKSLVVSSGASESSDKGKAPERTLAGYRPFTLVLIDANEFVFSDIMAATGAKGGQLAARKLLDAVSKIAAHSPEHEIVVKFLGTLEGLSQKIAGMGAPIASNDCHAFASGFSGSYAHVDFVNVSPGRAAAMNKLKNILHFFRGAPDCKHIVLGANLNDGPLVGYIAAAPLMPRDFLTILSLDRSTDSPNDGHYFERWAKIRFEGLFIDHGAVVKALVPPLPAVPTYASKLQNGMTSMKAVALNTVGPLGRPPTAPRRLSAPPNPNRSQSSSLPHTQPVELANKIKLRKIHLTDGGMREDCLLKPSKTALNWVRKVNLCPSLFLLGVCAAVQGSPNGCRRQHSCRALTEPEWEALWWYVRGQQSCPAGGKCRSERCIRGHSTEKEKETEKETSG